ncbi:prostaglandin E synthase 3-like [Scomber scombrus]|uniref:Prostaglandin E synthase 3 n=1 Tax=Scomber scombrus TaxID=13677 RepID=A0AAV1NE79_SCOSC
MTVKKIKAVGNVYKIRLAVTESSRNVSYALTASELPSSSSRCFICEKEAHFHADMHPATAKWYDRRDSVFIEFCVADSKDVKINFDKIKFGFSCLGGTDNVKHENEIDLFEAIDENKCQIWSRRTVRLWNEMEEQRARRIKTNVYLEIEGSDKQLYI